MAVCTSTKTYQTRAHMGMIDITKDFQNAVTAACREKGISTDTIPCFITDGVAGLSPHWNLSWAWYNMTSRQHSSHRFL